VVLNRRAHHPRDASINFQGGGSPYALYNMESLIGRFTNKYTSFAAYLKSGGLETKANYLRTTPLH